MVKRISNISEEDIEYLVKFAKEKYGDEYAKELKSSLFIENDNKEYIEDYEKERETKDYFDEYIQEYLLAIRSLMDSNDLELILFPILNLSHSLLELIVKQIYLEIDEYSKSINDLGIGHHSVLEIVKDKDFKYWGIEFHIINEKIYKLILAIAKYFDKYKFELKSLSFSSRYPIDKKSNSIKIKIDDIDLPELQKYIEFLLYIVLLLSEFQLEVVMWKLENTKKIFGE